MADQTIKVVIVDDHEGVRAGIRGLLSREGDIEVLAEGANGQEALDLALGTHPDVLLLDVELPIMRGEEVVRRVRKERSNVKVLAVSSYDDRHYIHGMLDNGAQGYITKEEAAEYLVEAIRKIAQGDAKWLSPKAARFMPAPATQHIQAMTQREAEVMQFLSADKTGDEIAASMGMLNERLQIYIRVLLAKYRVDTIERLRQIAKNIFSSDLKL